MASQDMEKHDALAVEAIQSVRNDRAETDISEKAVQILNPQPSIDPAE
jgi:hypothetical protein